MDFSHTADNLQEENNSKQKPNSNNNLRHHVRIHEDEIIQRQK